ncbi:MAG: hypothetical protein M0Z41_07185 [Peptococcaceae bacterium]|nr:hypothetical protein [Peptococcaceae bacterium]
MIKGNWSSSKRNAIELLNAALGTRYRSKPYDMNNPDDVAHMVTYISGEFMDLCHYSTEIDSMLEYLDESIETYYPAEWISADLAVSDIKTDIPMAKAYLQLRRAGKTMNKALVEAAARCKEAWSLFLGNPAYGKKALEITGLEEIPVLDQDTLKKIDIIDLAIEIDWPYVVHDSARQLGRSLINAATAAGGR